MPKQPQGVAFTAPRAAADPRLLSAEALAFLARLSRACEAERQRLLALRRERQKAFDKGLRPDFLPDTAAVRAGAWRVAPLPPDLQDRRVEIIAAPERKAMITALNTGAKGCVADFEDGCAPAWDNMLRGQINLMDRWTSAMEHVDPASGRRIALGQKPAVLMVRPRGLHLDEANVKVDGKPIAASFFDAGLYLFHNAKTARAKGSGPYLSLPKLESHLEARLWHSVFVLAQSLLGLPLGTIKATVLIETLPAAFEMDEIIYELRDHLAALALDPDDLMFSFLKTFAAHRSSALAERASLAAPKSFPAATAALLVKTCHRRGCLALGPTARLVPDRKDPAAVAAARAQMTSLLAGEARHGLDGTGVAHPELVPAALAVFNDMMPTPNQLYVSRDDAAITAADLLEITGGAPTEAGLRAAIRTGVLVLEARLRGAGSVAVSHRLEDVSAAEVCRALVWHWLKHGVKLKGGKKVTRAFFMSCLADEVKRLRDEWGQEAFASSRCKSAAALFRSLCTAKAFAPFLTAPVSKIL